MVTVRVQDRGRAAHPGPPPPPPLLKPVPNRFSKILRAASSSMPPPAPAIIACQNYRSLVEGQRL